MKNYIKNIGLFLFTLLLLLSCNKDQLKLISSYPFELEETHNSTSSVNIGERTLFEITPEQLLEINNFEFKYIVAEGDGYYVDNKGEKLLENISYSLSELSFAFDFVGESTGEVRTLVTISNDNEAYDQELTIVYDVLDRSFSFTASTSVSSLNLGESVNINYAITEQGAIEKDSYTLKYSTDNNGTLSIDGQEYDPGTVITITDLNFTAIFTANTDGEHIIISEITALSNGDIVEKENKVTYLSAEFTLDITSPNELIVGETIEIEFVINETVGQSDFDIEYFITGVEQEIKNDADIVLEKSTKYDVENNTFKLFLTGIDHGNPTIKWIVSNQFEETQEIEVTYTVNPVPFDFSVSFSSNNVFTNFPNRFIIDIDGDDDVTYDVQISTETDVVFFDDSFNQIFNDQITTVNNGTNTDILFLTTDRGQHIFEFTVTASNGAVETSSVTVNILEKIILNSFEATYTTSNNCNNDCSQYTTTTLVIDVTLDPTLSLSQIIIDSNNSLGFEDIVTTLSEFTNLGNGAYSVSITTPIAEDVEGVYFGPEADIEVTVVDTLNRDDELDGQLVITQERTISKNGESSVRVNN